MATAAGLDPEQDCAHSAQPLCAKTNGTALSFCRVGLSKHCPHAAATEEPPHVPPCSSCYRQHLDPVGPWAPQPYQGNQLIISRHRVASLTATGHSSYARSRALPPTHGQLVQHHTPSHGRGSPAAFIFPRQLLWLLHRVPGHPSLGEPAHHPKMGLPSGLGLPKPAVGAQRSAQARGNWAPKLGAPA